MKICKKCNINKPISEFSICNSLKSGISNSCKKCLSAENKIRYDRRVRLGLYKIVEYKQCYKCKNTLPKDSFNKSPNNKDRLSSYCKKCKSEWSLNKNLKRTVKQIYNSLKNSAKKRNLQVCTIEEFTSWYIIAEEKCYYCECDTEQFNINKISIFNEARLSRFREIFSNPVHKRIKNLTLDRKNPSLGYKISNMVKCCWICNYLKCGIWDHKDFSMLGVKVRMEIEDRL